MWVNRTQLCYKHPNHVHVGMTARYSQQFRVQGVFPVERTVPSLGGAQRSIKIQEDSRRRAGLVVYSRTYSLKKLKA